MNGDTDVIDELVRRGATVNSVDAQGATPLHKAVHFGMMSSVKRLVHHGADLNARDKARRSLPCRRLCIRH